MSGLEKLTQSILDEANENAALILDDAKKECEKITAESKARCDEITLKAQKEDDKKISLIKETAVSGAALAKKKELLKVKQSLISDIKAKVLDKLYGLDDAEYLNTLKRLAKKYAHENEKGEMLLNENDKKQIDSDFVNYISDLGLSLSERNASVKGGFILVYGGIEENCSFEAVLEGASDRVTDIVADEMFR